MFVQELQTPSRATWLPFCTSLEIRWGCPAFRSKEILQRPAKRRICSRRRGVSVSVDFNSTFRRQKLTLRGHPDGLSSLISVADVMIMSCQSISSSQHLNPCRNPAIWRYTNCCSLSMFLYCARCLLLIASRRNVTGGRRLLVAARDISRDPDYHGPLTSNKYKRMYSFNLFYMLRCFALAQSDVIISFWSLARILLPRHINAKPSGYQQQYSDWFNNCFLLLWRISEINISCS